ncbi:PO113 protein, partial [Lanius ludovicianus]|nr:PO113 protein [Lanius ludovicianus]
SVQVLKLQAAVQVFCDFAQQPFNLVVDSKYVSGLLPRLQHAALGHVSNEAIEALLIQLRNLLEQRKHAFWSIHINSHMGLPGVMAAGNDIIDRTVSATASSPMEQAAEAHAFFHQSARALKGQFQITKEQARSIVTSCPDCARNAPLQPMGPCHRGLQPRQIWQTDVTEVPQFGRLKHVHVTVDTCSTALWATAAASETPAAHIFFLHWLSAMAALGRPHEIQTDNGPAYHSHACAPFLAAWKIKHKTGIPYNSTGEAIVEHRHQDLKPSLKKE